MAALGGENGARKHDSIQLDQTKDDTGINENRISSSEDGRQASVDMVSPLEKGANCEFPAPSHTRKRSVLKREDRVRAPGTLQKRVSFSSSPSERRVSNASDCYTFMQNGTEFLKLRPGGRQYQRLYQLSTSLDMLVWRPSSKKPEKAVLPVDMIYEVRAGRSSAIFNEYGCDFRDDCCFSIVIGSSFDSIDLVAHTPEDAKIWITGIRLLTRRESPDESYQDMREHWLGQQFQAFDANGKQALSEKEVTALLRKMRISAPASIIRQKFQENVSRSSNPSKNSLTEDEFINFFKDITTRADIYFLMVKYSSTGKYLTTDDLVIFLETEQGMTWVGKEYCLEVINRCEPTEEGRKNQILGIDGFSRYLMDKDCDIISCEETKEITQDMTRPFSHYYIATSHNTYLLEDQLTGKSSVQAYVRALQKGCRCVELDCWDGPNSEPVIYHGRTLTSKINFYDVLIAIEDHAFETSEYPVILSLENHCGTKQQKVMAQYITEIFKDKLFTSAVNENFHHLPSPESLKWKFIVKNKKLPTSVSSDEGDVSEEEEDDVVSYSNGEDRGKMINESEGKNGTLGFSFKNSSKTSVQKQGDNQVHKTMKLAKELSDLVNICKSISFRSLQYSLENQKYWEMCSFSESVARRLGQSVPEEFISYNKRFLSRIYPAGKRVDSSNFNPQEFWNCGCQLVALNYQYPGLSMDVNRGRFLQNGRSGYVLKPAVLREEVAYYSPHMKGEIPGNSSFNVQLKIISGHQFPKPRGSTAKGDDVDPFIVIEIHGIPGDSKTFKTRTIPHNGYNPVFDETFEFHVNLPELALIRFVVLDDDFIGDGFIAQFTMPVECLQPGYRMVKLLSSSGESLSPASLFVHISITKTHEMPSFKIQRFPFVRALKKNKEFTSLKSVGLKAIDDTFKFSIQPLREAAILRENFHTSLGIFKDCCGLSPRSNLKQCIRMLAKRVLDIHDVGMFMAVDQEYPCLQVEGTLPNNLQRAVTAYDQLVEECKSLIENSTTVCQKLNHARRSALEWHEALPRICIREKIKEARATKVIENFSWNVRVMKGQSELLQSTATQCQEYLKQIHEASVATGLAKAISYSHE